MVENEMKRNLAGLLEKICGPGGHAAMADLQALDRFAREHGEVSDPRLLHFLRRRSYAKALAFLNGERDIPKGICGGNGDGEKEHRDG